jgi:dTDP-4-dehydrorhamnose 3,5-epimerase
VTIETFDIEGPILFKPTIHKDDRGYFLETYKSDLYRSHGVDASFVQDNHSYSTQGVLRGLHYQIDQPQDKLVFVLKGVVQDIIVDLRQSSPTFGQSLAVELSDQTGAQLFVPKGFAHGFETLSSEAYLYYKCSDVYAPKAERSIWALDPALDLPWKSDHPLLSPKDAQATPWEKVQPADLFD